MYSCLRLYGDFRACPECSIRENSTQESRSLMRSRPFASTLGGMALLHYLRCAASWTRLTLAERPNNPNHRSALCHFAVLMYDEVAEVSHHFFALRVRVEHEACFWPPMKDGRSTLKYLNILLLGFSRWGSTVTSLEDQSGLVCGK